NTASSGNPADSGADKMDGGGGNDVIYAEALDLTAATPVVLGGSGGTGAALGDSLLLDQPGRVVTQDLTFNNNMDPSATTGIGGFEQIKGGSGNDTITVTNSTTADGVYLFGGV